MFEKKEPFDWKIPVLILIGVLILSSGVYIGIKTKDLGKEKNIVKTNEINKKGEDTKEVFQLMESCEIWVDKKTNDGANINSESMMIGIAPKELLNKTKEEITAYLTEKYPDRSIESIGKSKIVLSEYTKDNSPSKANKYSLEDNNGFIGLYKYDENGKGKLIENTQIKINSLPKVVQEEIKNGVITDTEEEAYSRLEGFDT